MNIPIAPLYTILFFLVPTPLRGNADLSEKHTQSSMGSHGRPWESAEQRWWNPPPIAVMYLRTLCERAAIRELVCHTIAEGRRDLFSGAVSILPAASGEIFQPSGADPRVRGPVSIHLRRICSLQPLSDKYGLCPGFY